MPKKKATPPPAEAATAVMQPPAEQRDPRFSTCFDNAPSLRERTDQRQLQAASEAPDEPIAQPPPDPYRALFTRSAKGFEMGENYRFKQIMFRFRENPGPEVTGKLKEAGYVYRAGKKAWTTAASAASRELAVRLAREIKGEDLSLGR